MVEAATSAGSNPVQVITKVQLPASKKSLLLGANQGLIFVLAVIVIGGFVGAGGLGYLVIVGQSKPELAGKGLAAGLAIVLLGIILDRITQASARRSGTPRLMRVPSARRNRDEIAMQLGRIRHTRVASIARVERTS